MTHQSRVVSFTAVLMLAAITSAWLVGCAECDSEPCRDSCDDAYPNDDTQQSACYASCDEQLRDCLEAE